MVCLAHGSNDVANSISPLVIVLDQEQYSDWISFLIGSSGIALGLLILGHKVMETVGNKIV
jgi:PiT family inorganic phosphate transporter